MRFNTYYKLGKNTQNLKLKFLYDSFKDSRDYQYRQSYSQQSYIPNTDKIRESAIYTDKNKTYLYTGVSGLKIAAKTKSVFKVKLTNFSFQNYSSITTPPAYVTGTKIVPMFSPNNDFYLINIPEKQQFKTIKLEKESDEYIQPLSFSLSNVITEKQYCTLLSADTVVEMFCRGVNNSDYQPDKNFNSIKKLSDYLTDLIHRQSNITDGTDLMVDVENYYNKKADLIADKNALI